MIKIFQLNTENIQSIGERMNKGSSVVIKRLRILLRQGLQYLAFTHAGLTIFCFYSCRASSSSILFLLIQGLQQQYFVFTWAGLTVVVYFYSGMAYSIFFLVKAFFPFTQAGIPLFCFYSGRAFLFLFYSGSVNIILFYLSFTVVLI